MSEPKRLLDHQDALQQYLQDMLNESITTDELVETPPTPVQSPSLPTNVVAHAPETIKAPQPEESAPVEQTISTTFQALIFEVQGISLALPLEQLNGIEKWPETPLHKIADKPAHYIGLLSQPGLHTQVVDPSVVLQPESQDQRPARYILLVDDKRWGLAVTSVKKVMTITEEDCKWRQPGQRPWFAGTLLSGLTHVLDLPALLKAL